MCLYWRHVQAMGEVIRNLGYDKNHYDGMMDITNLMGPQGYFDFIMSPMTFSLDIVRTGSVTE